MSIPIIKVNNISKRYRIGAREQGYKTIRETIMDGISAPIRNLAKLRSLTKFKEGYEEDVIWALKDVSFEVNKGEVLGIIGRNGAGKSTLLKILSRITEPTGGFAEIHGRISSLLEVGTGFHPELTGRENVFLNGAILGMRKQEIERKFDDIVGFAEIEKYIDTPVKRFSTGMQVRLAFAVAAHLEPEILLIDEVLAVGDAAFQKKSLGKMEDVARGGRTVLFVSHNMGMINTLCARCILLESGEIVEDGETSSVISKYLANVTSAIGNEQSFPEDRSKKFQIRRVAVADPKLNPKARFDVFEPVTVEIEYEVREEMIGSLVAIALYREGVLLFQSYDTDHNRELLNKRLPGCYRAQVNLPCPLKAGAYTMDVNTVIANTEFIDHIREALAFEVEEFSFNVSFRSISRDKAGIIAADLVWKTESLEDG
ncbi:ABC transporter ATP-binding protein [Chloroflexota bacterium]